MEIIEVAYVSGIQGYTDAIAAQILTVKLFDCTLGIVARQILKNTENVSDNVINLTFFHTHPSPALSRSMSA